MTRNALAVMIAVWMVLFSARFARAEDPPAAPAPPAQQKTAADKEADATAQRLLDREIPEINFNANALSDVINFFRDVAGAKIAVDWDALEKAGIKKDTPVTLRLSATKFSTILEMILDHACTGKSKATYQLRKGVISISTSSNFRGETQAYDIGKLIGEKAEPAAREKRVAAIVRLVTGSVDPESWRDNGGSIGAIKENSGKLVVTQTAENQKAVANIIEQLGVLLEAGK